MQLNSPITKLTDLKRFRNFFLVLFLCIFLPEIAMAQSATAAIEDVLCEIIAWFTGKVGQGIATLGMIALGMGGLFGKIEPGKGIVLVSGIAVMFGAAELLTALNLPGLTTVNCTGGQSTSAAVIGDALCTVAGWLSGGVGKAIIIAAVIILGMMTLFGRVAFHYGIILVAGIGIVAGAAEIVTALGTGVTLTSGGTITGC